MTHSNPPAEFQPASRRKNAFIFHMGTYPQDVSGLVSRLKQSSTYLTVDMRCPLVTREKAPSPDQMYASLRREKILYTYLGEMVCQYAPGHPEVEFQSPHSTMLNPQERFQMTLEAMVDLLEQGNDHEGIAFLCTIPGQEHCPCGMDAQMTSVLHQIGVHVMESPADSLENSSSTLQVISPSVSKIKTPSDK